MLLARKSLVNILNDKGKSAFFFGKNHKFTSDSLFKYSFDIAYESVQDYYFIVFDVILISNEKYSIDYV
jgi:hypothetical protein